MPLHQAKPVKVLEIFIKRVIEKVLLKRETEKPFRGLILTLCTASLAAW